MSAPSIETARLQLKPHVREDYVDCVALWSDPVVTQYIGGRPFTREEVWSRLSSYVGHWSLMGFGYWVISEKASGRFVGEIGFADFKREIVPGFDGAPEGGWALMPWAHGRGFATEALVAAHGWLDSTVRPGRTVCLIDPSNLASIRVGEKCGYREWQRTTYRAHPTIVFERLA